MKLDFLSEKQKKAVYWALLIVMTLILFYNAT